MNKIDERQMREALIRRLSTYKDCSIYQEITVPSGNARADIVAISGHVVAYEIKSDFDTLTRLESQIKEYDKVFELNNVVISKKNLSNVEKLLPAHWGIILISTLNNASLDISFFRRAKLNQNISFVEFMDLLPVSELKNLALQQRKISQLYSKAEIRSMLKRKLLLEMDATLSISSKRELKSIARNILKKSMNGKFATVAKNGKEIRE